MIQKCNFIDPQLPSYVISPTLLISGQHSWSILPEVVQSGNFGLTKLVILSRNKQFWLANPEIDFIGRTEIDSSGYFHGIDFTFKSISS